MKPWPGCLLVWASALVFGVSPLCGQTDRKAASVELPENVSAHKYFTDVPLIDQQGREQRLYSDLMRGKVVVISAMFTQCTGSCPVMAATFQKLQSRLGDRLGSEVQLISISVDPEHDSPARLREFARRFDAKPGWHLLTGTRDNLDTALHKLGLWVENREAHGNVMLIGNDRTGLWKKAFGLADVGEIYKILESVLNDSGS
jgi:protein SCO1/2